MRTSSRKPSLLHLLLSLTCSFLAIGCAKILNSTPRTSSTAASSPSIQPSPPTTSGFLIPTAGMTPNVLATQWPTLIPVWLPTQNPLQTPEPTVTAPPTRYPPIVLPENWHMEEFSQGSGSFVQRHWRELGGMYYRPLQHELDFGTGTLRLNTYLTNKPDNPSEICEAILHTQVFLDRTEIFSIENGKQVGCFAPILDFWTYEQHWALEVSRCLGEDISQLQCFYEVILDGESQNQLNGYDRAFGFQLIDDKPFYFFERNKRFGFSYDYIEFPLNFTDIWYASCCAATEKNPRQFQNGVVFSANYGTDRYDIVLGLIHSP